MIFCVEKTGMTKRIFQSICFLALSVFPVFMTLFLGVLVQFLHSVQPLFQDMPSRYGMIW